MKKAIANLSTSKFFLFSFLIIAVCSYLVFKKVFLLSFTDDDWLGILVSKNRIADIGPISYLFSPYGGQAQFFYFFYHIFGFNQPMYFLLALILRIFSSFCLLVAILCLTGRRLPAFIGALFFALGFSGIQVLTEPVNMISYLIVAITCIFLISFFQSRDRPSLKIYIIFMVTFFFALFLSPIRLYPLTAWCFTADILWLISSISKNRLKWFFIRNVILSTIFIFLLQSGSFGTLSSKDNAFISSAVRSLGLIDNLSSFQLLNNITVGIGNVIFPDERNFLTLLFGININGWIGSCYIIILVIFTFLFFKKRKNSYLNILSFLIWLPLFYLSYIIVSASQSGEVIIESFRRYLLVPFLGLVISLSLFINSVFNAKRKFYTFKSLLIMTVLLTILIHTLTSSSYLTEISKKRNFLFANFFWSALKTRVPILKTTPGEPFLFYIEPAEPPLINETIFKGFQTHAAILYDIPQPAGNRLGSNPIPVDNINTLAALVKDGSPLKAQGYKVKPVSWDRIYAFRISENELIDIKEKIRQKVDRLLNNPQ